MASPPSWSSPGSARSEALNIATAQLTQLELQRGARIGFGRTLGIGECFSRGTPGQGELWIRPKIGFKREHGLPAAGDPLL